MQNIISLRNFYLHVASQSKESNGEQLQTLFFSDVARIVVRYLGIFWTGQLPLSPRPLRPSDAALFLFQILTSLLFFASWAMWTEPDGSSYWEGL